MAAITDNNKMRLPYKLSIEEVLSHVDANTPKYKSVFFHNVDVNVGIDNIKLYKEKGTVCTCCEIKGAYFYLERSYGPPHIIYSDWHLNLYALNKYGQEVLMTKDHITPKSKGGPNTLENYQPMCSVCNERKGDKSTSNKPDIKLDSFTEQDQMYITHTIKRLDERHNIKITVSDYIQINNVIKNVRPVHYMTVHRSIRFAEANGVNIAFLYDDKFKMIRTCLKEKEEVDILRLVPKWAEPAKDHALKLYDEIWEIANNEMQILSDSKSTAQYIESCQYPKIMFMIWKNRSRREINLIMWETIRRKLKMLEEVTK